MTLLGEMKGTELRESHERTLVESFTAFVAEVQPGLMHALATRAPSGSLEVKHEQQTA